MDQTKLLAVLAFNQLLATQLTNELLLCQLEGRDTEAPRLRNRFNELDAIIRKHSATVADAVGTDGE